MISPGLQRCMRTAINLTRDRDVDAAPTFFFFFPSFLRFQLSFWAVTNLDTSESNQ